MLRILLITLCQTLFMLSSSVLANSNPLSLYGARAEYAVYRDNSRIGRQVLNFQYENNNLLVSAKADFAVRFLLIPVYQFQYRSTSLWAGDLLLEMNVQVNDDGKESTLNAKRRGEELHYSGLEETGSVSGVVFPTNHWNSNVLTQDVVLNTLTGRLNKVEIRQLGEDRFRFEGEEQTAYRYRYEGDLDTDVWYDQDGRWVGMRFLARDGSTIEYRCVKCRADQ